MTTEGSHALEAVRPRLPGRWRFRLGWALLLTGLIVYGVQLVALKQFVVPWYAPVLGTMGVVAMLSAMRQRWTLWRTVGLALCALLVALQWFFLVSASRLPTYAGPETGHKFPAFTAVRADGSPFTERNLGEQATVLLFFRGRW
jgi:hypothetical protein